MSSNNQENYEQLGSVSVSNIFSLLNKELFSYLKIGKLPNIRISVPLGSIPSRERSHKLQRPSRQVDNSDLLEIIESPLSVSQRKHSIASKFQFLIDTLEMEKYIHQNKLKTSSSNINNNNNNNNDKGNDEKSNHDKNNNVTNSFVSDNQSNNQSSISEEDTSISNSIISYNESNSLIYEVEENFEETKDNMESNFDRFSQFLQPHYRKALMLFGIAGSAYWLYSAINPKLSKDELGGGTYQSMAKYKEYTQEEIALAVKKDSQLFKDPKKTDLKTILILYGTEYGASKEISIMMHDKILQELGEENYWPRCVNMEDYDWLEFDKEMIIIVICSTFGDGEKKKNNLSEKNYKKKKNFFFQFRD
eukprot:TRINITY_DN48_c0_g2_i6.p1 TRINITY_DN48_c0_g2~~TRINITY_DN48_c0_g2_i6.p1  ORF type:complete len:363 (+),score=77.47 TRINITY_DN48_c0_g2_i6:140-1228(+)